MKSQYVASFNLQLSVAVVTAAGRFEDTYIKQSYCGLCYVDKYEFQIQFPRFLLAITTVL